MQHHKKAVTLSIYIPHASGHANKSKAINILLKIMRHEDHAKSRTICRLLKGVVPPGVPIESVLIDNVCARAKVVLSGTKQDVFGVEHN